ncbi:MAG TPA: gamma-glutamyltransferase family protein, partial [Magnetospirillaceae bacterium]|nr:gamma-glutamyltransferase family protein [Magnetospirillaceae bacterium]
MLNSAWATRGMVVAPHSLAAEAGCAILREGGNAIEAMIAAASVIAMVYPHMNGIGGDGFWVVLPPGGSPFAVEACGPAAGLATLDWYRQRDLPAIPTRGPNAALTMAGAVGGWSVALERSRGLGGRLPLSRLLADAIYYGKEGFPVSPSQTLCTEQKLAELASQPGFAGEFLPDGRPPEAGSLMRRPRLAATFEALIADGLDSFYRGELGRSMADDLEKLGSPLRHADFALYKARVVEPATLAHGGGHLFNMTLPTQGPVSLAILGIAERAGLAGLRPDSADHIHCLVEATKLAFGLRDAYVTDPDCAPLKVEEILSAQRLDQLAAKIDMKKALPWGQGHKPSDTVWLGAIDKDGLAVSFIQSIYHEYGSGLVLDGSGINWQNRGASFKLDAGHLWALASGKKPFHTLNPAAARLAGERTMVYGTMGGDGQPQTQAAVFSRHAVFGQTLQQAVSGPRWLLGRT